ncbi:hypothetical protein [Altericista sp. CCNU0014]
MLKSDKWRSLSTRDPLALASRDRYGLRSPSLPILGDRFIAKEESSTGDM